MNLFTCLHSEPLPSLSILSGCWLYLPTLSNGGFLRHLEQGCQDAAGRRRGTEDVDRDWLRQCGQYRRYALPEPGEEAGCAERSRGLFDLEDGRIGDHGHVEGAAETELAEQVE